MQVSMPYKIVAVDDEPQIIRILRSLLGAIWGALTPLSEQLGY
jgi:hypothetical protein